MELEKKSITVKDIARMLGLSKSTVSRALGGKSDIHPETRKKIVALAEELKYEKNSIAVSLKQRKTNTIGVIVPETINRFFARAIGGIQTRAEMAGLNVMICQSNESYITEKKNLQSLLGSRVDGLIVSVSGETDSSSHFLSLREKGIPLVFFDRILEDVATSQVVTNNFDVAYQGTDHLIQQGCRNIAFLTGPAHLSTSKSRLDGYLNAVRKSNLTVNESQIIYAPYGTNKAESFTRHLLSLPQRPDAIFAINDYMALEMMHIIKKSGLRIPEDVAILGFNNENMSEFVEPSLSSIEHPAHDIGMAAADLVINHIFYNDYAPEKRVINSRLVVRNSTLRKHS
jgi:DNA-binding LacI/PurR family transcriptional regulator